MDRVKVTIWRTTGISDLKQNLSSSLGTITDSHPTDPGWHKVWYKTSRMIRSENQFI